MAWAFLFALFPLLAQKFVSDQEMDASRDAWLLITLSLVAAAVWPWAPWFTPMLWWFLVFWRGPDRLPSLVTWLGIGASWWLLRSLPAPYWPVIPYLWLVIGAWHVLILGLQFDPKRRVGHEGPRLAPMPAWLVKITKGHAQYRTRRPPGLLGSPPTTALFLALVAPFAPWWLVPLYVGGIMLTGSYVALGAVLIGLGVVYPPVAPFVACSASLGVLAVSLMLWLERNPKVHWWAWWLDRLPHGASLDGLRARLNVWLVIYHVSWLTPWQTVVLGRGPWTLPKELRRRSFQWDLPGADSGAFCEVLGLAWDYGVFGVVAFGLFAWQVSTGMRWGDPWSAAMVTAGVLSLMHFPGRLPQTGLVILAIGAKLATSTS